MCEEIANMSKLEIASSLFWTTFEEHAGDDHLLDKKEFTKLIKSEMCQMCDKAHEEHPEEFDKFFETLDTNNDDKIDFDEFMAYMGKFTCLCYAIACHLEQQEQEQQQCKKGGSRARATNQCSR